LPPFCHPKYTSLESPLLLRYPHVVLLHHHHHHLHQRVVYIGAAGVTRVVAMCASGRQCSREQEEDKEKEEEGFFVSFSG